MKPASFTYRKAGTIEEALALLDTEGEDAKLLAGGQSLVPMMNFRLARPTALIDINPIRELDFITASEDDLKIGALTRHLSLEDESRFPEEWRILPEVARWIGHYPIRTRGTFGGSIAHADPSAELPVLSLAVDGRFEIRGPSDTRSVEAAGFFKGPFQADVEANEMLVSVSLPTPPTGAAFSVQEFARRAGDFAIVLVVAGLVVNDGVCEWARIALGGVDGVPLRAAAVESGLLGQPANEEIFRNAGQAAARDVDPPADVHASTAYRKHLVGVLVKRALSEAASRSRQNRSGDVSA